MAANLDQIRHELAALAKRKDRRFLGWPRDWGPRKVRNPETPGLFFTGHGAWWFIAEKLEQGHPIREIILDEPPGARAYVMEVDIGSDVPPLYIKLQCVSGKVIGRSFHYGNR